MEDVLVIGVAGGSGSGKTTLVAAIKDRMGDDVVVLSHDSYYRAHHELSYEERTRLNYDHPDTYETELLVEHLAALRRGEGVQVPLYDYALYDRTDETVSVMPSRVIIVEGIIILSDPRLREAMDVKVFVDADPDVRVLRRAMRDMRERGRSFESVAAQYLATVKPMHDGLVEPSKRHADVIVPKGGENAEAVELLVARIRAHLAR